ncbi:hypothetical protein [Hubei virga-like virus 23]|uniref:hypothetical protein n=1 Tax=Hubei virga-like virus 23 TaxID=1923338 RepID=UPI00090BF00F|nr:hypothetical protein [Hubei virga-like virus 23]APG77649.1 hypothetical protein [Hubei virga-like virus 23]
MSNPKLYHGVSFNVIINDIDTDGERFDVKCTIILYENTSTHYSLLGYHNQYCSPIRITKNKPKPYIHVVTDTCIFFPPEMHSNKSEFNCVFTRSTPEIDRINMFRSEIHCALNKTGLLLPCSVSTDVSHKIIRYIDLATDDGFYNN